MNPHAIFLSFFLFLSPLLAQTQVNKASKRKDSAKPTIIFKQEGVSDLYILNNTVNIDDYAVGEQIMITSVSSKNNIEEQTLDVSNVPLKKVTSETTSSLGNQTIHEQADQKTRGFKTSVKAKAKKRKKSRKFKSKKKKKFFSFLKKRKKLKKRKLKKRNAQNNCYRF